MILQKEIINTPKTSRTGGWLAFLVVLIAGAFGGAMIANQIDRDECNGAVVDAAKRLAQFELTLTRAAKSPSRNKYICVRGQWQSLSPTAAGLYQSGTCYDSEYIEEYSSGTISGQITNTSPFTSGWTSGWIVKDGGASIIPDASDSIFELEVGSDPGSGIQTQTTDQVTITRTMRNYSDAHAAIYPH